MASITVTQIAETVEEIISLYRKYGSENYIGEPVSQIEHMCQCAQLAQRQNFDDEVVLAAFFHDIGHLLEHVTQAEQMEGFGVVDHEKLGAEYLRSRGFSDRIALLVNSHVAAKRYLTYKYPEYYSKLSEASRATLMFQGGRMSPAEAEAFEADPQHPIYLELRKWDEAAKVQDHPLPALELYKAKMINHLLDRMDEERASMETNNYA